MRTADDPHLMHVPGDDGVVVGRERRVYYPGVFLEGSILSAWHLRCIAVLNACFSLSFSRGRCCQLGT